MKAAHSGPSGRAPGSARPSPSEITSAEVSVLLEPVSCAVKTELAHRGSCCGPPSPLSHRWAMHFRFTLCRSLAVLSARCEPVSKLPQRCLLFLAVLLGAGCGSAAGRDYSPPFVTFFGVITSSEVQTPSEVRVALVWRKRDPEGNL